MFCNGLAAHMAATPWNSSNQILCELGGGSGHVEAPRRISRLEWGKDQFPLGQAGKRACQTQGASLIAAALLTALTQVEYPVICKYLIVKSKPKNSGRRGTTPRQTGAVMAIEIGSSGG